MSQRLPICSKVIGSMHRVSMIPANWFARSVFVKLHGQLEIEAKASHVPIRAANEAPVAINRHQLRMVEQWRTPPEMTPCLPLSAINA
jgi:hypothetical protein